MAKFGVTADGFVVKGFDAIVADAMARARDAFGDDVDLSATSTVRKLLEVTAAEDAQLWRRLEDLYYSNFLSAAVGDDLDLLGEDVGVTRRFLYAAGEVTITVEQPQPGRTYALPEGTVLVTAGPPVVAFHTTAPASVSADAPGVTVAAQAFERGPAGDVPAAAIVGVDPVYQQLHLDLAPPATLRASNQQPFAGGDRTEPDDDYRARLLGFPRNIWTLESVQTAVLDVPGVIDVLLSDPLGGVDVSQSYFNLFLFGQRPFSSERRLGEPYFFDVVVAHEFARPWRTQGPVTGVYEQVVAAVDRVRPVGIHPNVVEADHIEVGVRAQVIIQPGYDTQALLAAFSERLAAGVGALKLGGDVLFSQVMRLFVEQPGVVDVQDMHLRRCPPAFGQITFGQVPFQTEVLEAGAGENLVMGPTEIAVFRLDSELIDLEVVPR
jgi:phage-related baseplate assembly protein